MANKQISEFNNLRNTLRNDYFIYKNKPLHMKEKIW